MVSRITLKEAVRLALVSDTAKALIARLHSANERRDGSEANKAADKLSEAVTALVEQMAQTQKNRPDH